MADLPHYVIAADEAMNMEDLRAQLADARRALRDARDDGAKAMREACAVACMRRAAVSRSHGSWADAFEAAAQTVRAVEIPVIEG